MQYSHVWLSVLHCRTLGHADERKNPVTLPVFLYTISLSAAAKFVEHLLNGTTLSGFRRQH
jgi:hypothetical protein